MTQYARPASDIATGNWTDEGTTDNDGNLYTSLDEVTSDGDDSYVNGDDTATVFCVKLGAISEPGDPTQCNFHLLMRSSGSGGPEKLDVILYEDYEVTPVQRGSWQNQSNRSGSYSDVTAGIVDLSAVTDWSNLYVEGTADSIASGEWVRVTQIYLEAPDPGAGNVYNESISEGIQIIETKGANMVYGLNMAEGIPTGDNLAPMAIFNLNRNEPTRIADALKLRAVFAGNIAEGVRLSEVLIAAYIANLSLSESTALTDTIIAWLAQEMEALDTADFEFVDTADFEWLIRAEAAEGGQTFNESLSESISLSESLKTVLTVYAAMQEQFRTLDTLRLAGVYNNNIAESFAIAEAVKALLKFSVKVPETASIADAYKATLKAYLNLAESTYLADVFTTAGPIELSISESMRLSDDIKARLIFSNSAIERIRLSEAFNAMLVFSINVPETVPVSERLLAMLKVFVKVSEGLPFTEAVADSDVVQGIGEWVETAGFEFVDTADAEWVTKVLAKDTYNETLSETMRIADTSSMAFRFARALQEVMRLSETLTFQLAGEGYVYNETIGENLRAAETLAGLFIFSRLLQETLGIAESTAMMFVHAIAVAEGVSVIESSQARIVFNLSVSEPARVADVLTGIFRFGLMMTENMTAGEIVVGSVTTPTIEIRRGKSFIFTIDVVHPRSGVAKKPGKPDHELH